MRGALRCGLSQTCRFSCKKCYCQNRKQSGLPKTRLDYFSRLQYNVPMNPYRLTGLICTIGPASKSPEKIEELITNGLTIVRLNFSHGTYDYHAESIDNARKAIQSFSCKYGAPYPVAIALDTKGPEIRTGLISGSDTAELELNAKDIIKLTTDKQNEDKCTKDLLYVDYKNISKLLKAGNHVYIDDGLISLLVKEVQNDSVVCEIENGGKLGSRKGVNLPGVMIDLPAVSEKDKLDFEFGVKQGVDMIFASFIRNAAALDEIRCMLGEEGRHIKIISKIENQQGMQNIDEIIEASDGIMIARGDLGIEIVTEEVPLAQKMIIARCNIAGKPVICATQMLESMIAKPRPTRAEASDVANAVFDGIDCVMLSGETAKGKYPAECVKTMSNICRKVETVLWYDNIQSEQKATFNVGSNCPDIAAAPAAAETASRVKANAILIISEDSRIAEATSRLRPACPIVFSTTNQSHARQCRLFRGIYPLILDPEETCNTESYIRASLDRLFKIQLLDPKKNPVVVFVNAMHPEETAVQVMNIDC